MPPIPVAQTMRLRSPFLTLNPGSPATFNVQVTNTTGKTAYLYAFVDWNMDGTFSGANETVIVQVPTATAGSVPVTFNVPSDAVLGMDLGARFRLSTAANLGPYSYIQLLPIENFEAELTNVSREAPDGEVEDYLVTGDPVPSTSATCRHTGDGHRRRQLPDAAGRQRPAPHCHRRHTGHSARLGDQRPAQRHGHRR